MEDVSEPVKDRVNSSRRNFGQFLSDLLQERDPDLHRVVRRSLEQQRQYLQRQNFVRNLEKDRFFNFYENVVLNFKMITFPNIFHTISPFQNGT